MPVGGAMDYALYRLRGQTWITALPLWAKLLAIFGFPTFVALFYMAQSTGLLLSVGATAAELQKHTAQTERLIQDIEAGRKIQRQICRNTSRNQAQEVE